MDAIESGIVKIPRVPVSDDSMTGDRSDVPRPVAPRARRSSAEGHQGHADRRSPRDPQGARRRAAEPVRRLRTQPRGLGCGRHGHAAGVHRRLLEHGDIEARLRLDRRLGEGAARRLDESRSLATSHSSPTFETAASSTARTRSWSTPPSSTGRRPRPGVPEGRRRRDRPVQARVRGALPGSLGGRHHRRRDPARGHEHSRQAGQARASTSAASCPSRC